MKIIIKGKITRKPSFGTCHRIVYTGTKFRGSKQRVISCPERGEGPKLPREREKNGAICGGKHVFEDRMYWLRACRRVLLDQSWARG